MSESNERISEPEWAASVAIDWADQKHAWTLQAAGSGQRERGELPATPEAVETWAGELAARFGGRPIAVALEQSRGPLVWMLTKYAHFVLFPVHPTTLAKFREAFYPSGAKDDPSDADLLLDLLTQHRSRLRRLHPDTPQTRQLQFLVQHRRGWVDERTGHTNRLTDLLKGYFPQILRWFDDSDSPMLGVFLRKWPTLEEAQKAQDKTLLRFFQQHHGRTERSQERLRQIRQACPAIRDAAVLESSVLAVRHLLAMLEVLRQAIAEYDRRIHQLAAEHPDFPVFDSLPGAGPVLVPRLIAAFGTQRDRFASAADLQAYSGIAPVLQRSGKSSWTHFRWACPKFLRQTFHEWAGHSLTQSVWARAYYQRRRAKGQSHQAAVRALAFKWIRIAFRCWKEGTPYDETRYLRALQLRGSPLASVLGQS